MTDDRPPAEPGDPLAMTLLDEDVLRMFTSWLEVWQPAGVGRTSPRSSLTSEAMTSAGLLAELGERIAADGPAAHHLLLQHVSSLVAATAPGTAAALVDRSAPVVVRQRALAVASAVLLRRPAEDNLTSLRAA